ncbi:MAG: chemotaxis protein CheW [Campylobacterota bacterium]|nr:chemotaxis protein CheW [Campylobacterota bacterium]
MIFNFLNGNYAVDLKKIKVVLVYSQVQITKLYAEKPWVSGVTNLRGEVVPVIDLRVRFGHTEPTFEKNCVIMVIKTNEDKLIGIIVDNIVSIKEINSEIIANAPDLGVGIEPEFIVGLYKDSNKEMITLLDIDKILKIDRLTS